MAKKDLAADDEETIGHTIEIRLELTGFVLKTRDSFR